MPPRSPVGDYARHQRRLSALRRAVDLHRRDRNLHFTAGWLEACQEQLAADDRIGVVGTVDGATRAPRPVTRPHTASSPAPTPTRAAPSTPGRILHEGYLDEMVDDELVATARHRDAYAHAFNALVTHRHWSDGGRPRNHVDADHELRMVAGRRLFNQRAPLWAAA